MFKEDDKAKWKDTSARLAGGIKCSPLGDHSGKDDLHGYGYFYGTFLRIHGVIKTLLLSRYSCSLQAKNNNRTPPAGRRILKARNIQLIRLLSRPQQLYPEVHSGLQTMERIVLKRRGV